MEFNKLENEKEYHFIWKVYSYMSQTGNITTEQAGNICNRELRLDFDESRHRKIYESFMKVWNQVKEEYITEESLLEQIEDIEEKKDELFKERVKAKDWTREKRSTLRNEARVEQIKESFKDAYENSDETHISKYEEKHIGELTGTLLLSDFHVGIEIQNYWNTFNTEVFQERLQTIVHKVMKQAKRLNIGTLYVLSLGDLISGSIHATTRLAEEIDVLDQVMFVAKAMKNVLIELSDFGLNIKYVSVVGNHGRLNKIWKEHIEKESFNKLVDWYILDKIEDGVLNIEFINNEIDDGIGHFVINGNDCFMVHGHQDNANTVLTNLMMATGIVPKYIFMGHYHNKNTFTKGSSKVFINGSLVGVDEYAKDKRYFTPPSQSLIVFDDNDIIDIELNL